MIQCPVCRSTEMVPCYDEEGAPWVCYRCGAVTDEETLEDMEAAREWADEIERTCDVVEVEMGVAGEWGRS